MTENKIFKDNYGAIIPHTLCGDKDLTPTDTLVYGIINGFNSNGLWFYGSNELLALRANSNIRSVQASIKKLAERKLIVIHRENEEKFNIIFKELREAGFSLSEIKHKRLIASNLFLPVSRCAESYSPAESRDAEKRDAESSSAGICTQIDIDSNNKDLNNNISNNIPKNENDDFNGLKEALINGLKNSIEISNEIEANELYGQPTQTHRLPLDSSTQANLEAVDPNKVANLLPKCSYFKISEHEKGLVRAWFKENNMTDLHIKLAIQEVDNWMAKADKKSSDGYKARSAPTHFRRLYDSWVIKNIAERFKAIASMQNVGKTQIEANSYQEYFEAFNEYPASSKLTFDEMDRLSQHKAFQKFNNSSKELKKN